MDYVHIDNLNNEAVFKAIDTVLNHIDYSKRKISDVIEALNYVCFANNPLFMQMSKDRLSSYIKDYSSLSLEDHLELWTH